MDQAGHLRLLSEPCIVVVSGVSGSGKTETGRALAASLGVPFKEGDDFHPAANIAKMHAGVALNDADRAPWLTAIAGWIANATAQRESGVVSCSALKRSYRDRLRAAGGAGLRIVLLDPAEPVLRARLANRQGHFMPASLLASQLDTLELPTPDEHVLVLTQDEGVAALVTRVEAWLAANGNRPVS